MHVKNLSGKKIEKKKLERKTGSRRPVGEGKLIAVTVSHQDPGNYIGEFRKIRN